MQQRQYSPLDHWLMEVQHGLETVFGSPQATGRPDPAAKTPEGNLDARQKRLAGRLMRINHSGEVCAQALYQGQAMACKNPVIKEKLGRAAAEESDHLLWCQRRLAALDSRKSLLNPLWYTGSLMIGLATGIIGDRASLGFLRETEQQVTQHLYRHIQRLPQGDHRSRQVLQQMQLDERQHASTATETGAAELPGIVKKVMELSAKVMTGTTFWL
ncbi:MAG TPA: 2-polyprenyl-3-methyl-6-methoxy-1,4-benzoquinone monooxygenase [Gammaproteobacteria bacterium]|nr:2-polyprenyl-3-methyl-6-methoxy-1,4-benzoquinone monooxygenase [Gammaproteobacteria bacterium]